MAGSELRLHRAELSTHSAQPIHFPVYSLPSFPRVHSPLAPTFYNYKLRTVPPVIL